LSPLLAKFQPDDSSTRVARAVREGEAARVTTFTGTAAGDAQKLRGIPCIGPNVAGAICHTRPDREILKLDDR
jgi:hypothetical protein